jgi:putative ABC transport system ATP-binding protein
MERCAHVFLRTRTDDRQVECEKERAILAEVTMRAQANPSLIVRAEKLGRSVPAKILVAEASFEVRKGETLAIVGPSGSGKTSLLRLLNRLDEPTNGTVYLKGVDYREIAPRDLRRRVGMVMQRPYLFPGTVADNLQFGPRQRGETLSEDRVEQLLAGVGLAGYRLRDVANLSGGEAQRVSFARSLANGPEVLLLDEPTSALDEDSKREVEAIVQQIGREPGIPCVLVTHDAAQAVRLAQRALVLEAGRIVRSGAVEEVLGA